MNTNQVVARKVGRLTAVHDQRTPAHDSMGPPTDATTYSLSTSEFAALNQVKAQTVRKRFCITGGYFSIRPKKLANNRLAWPAIQVTA